MKPGESVRCVCHECLTTYYITLAPRGEWPEGPETPGDFTANYAMQDEIQCPFCLSSDVKQGRQLARKKGGA